MKFNLLVSTFAAHLVQARDIHNVYLQRQDDAIPIEIANRPEKVHNGGGTFDTIYPAAKGIPGDASRLSDSDDDYLVDTAPQKLSKL